MKYVSTRGRARPLDFTDALLAGLAEDGGLYVPHHWPRLSAHEIQSMAGLSYASLAHRVMHPLVGDSIASGVLKKLIDESYAGFDHAAITPLVQLDHSHWLLELFHGPTLAFKDVALQLVGRLFDTVLSQRSETVNILVATSGDTGSAAIHAIRGRDTANIFVLHPRGRTSEIQRRQMTTVLDSNVHNIAIEGTFDDCQALVKAMFNHAPFRSRARLSGMNSINWARVMPQIVYYFHAALSLGGGARPLDFCVPTGNFGDVYAGYAARRMGLPVHRLLVATNENDILARTLATGKYTPGAVHPTISPSMDIQVSSNFERLLYEACSRDAAQVQALMDSLPQSGEFMLPPAAHDYISGMFSAYRVDEAATLGEIARTYKETAMLIDPHTAVGRAAARRHAGDPAIPMVCLATAHPAKFPDAVEKATGVRPQLPPRYADLRQLPERYATLANDLSQVQAFIEAKIQ
ncbi:MAG: threonine synthase [Alphaproteobacteria bacterium]|nr:threonine synthase [Alphaproteobacteria bacterium]